MLLKKVKDRYKTINNSPINQFRADTTLNEFSSKKWLFKIQCTTANTVSSEAFPSGIMQYPNADHLVTATEKLHS